MSAFLLLRVAAYAGFGAIAARADWAAFDATTGLLTLDTNSLAAALSGPGGIAGVVGTFVLSRLAKARGGAT